MHNLLSLPERKVRLRQYQLRRAVIALVLASIVLAITALSLVPSVFSVMSERAIVEQEAQALDALLKEGGDREPREVLKETAAIRERLALLGEETPLTETVATLLNARPQGVTVYSFTFERSQATLYLEGVAARRDTLVAYARVLEAVPEVEKAVLPIGDLAKGTDLDWRMTITLATSSPKQSAPTL